MGEENSDDALRGLADTLKSLADNPSKTHQDPLLWRQRIHTISQDLAIQSLGAAEYIIATAFSINMLLCIRVCIELGIFKLLDEIAPRSMSAFGIAKRVKAEELLCVRFMRAACSLRFASEAGVEEYMANEITHAISNPGLAAGFSLLFDNAARPHSNLWSHMEYFRSQGFKCPTDAKKGPYQDANDCIGSTTFDHWMRDEAESTRFNTFMTVIRGCASMTQDEVLMVDVGGGYGHDLAGFLEKHGQQFPGRVICQDLPVVIQQSNTKSRNSRIEYQEHDFFTPQPILGARAYFMHMIMHDWQDTECVKILHHIRDAMGSNYSQLLLNDAVLPDIGCPLIPTTLDITMMAHHCALERSEKMWRTLISKVGGLELVRIWPTSGGEGLIQVIKVDD